MSHHHDDHDDHGGLVRDLWATHRLLHRRDALRLALGASALAVFGCSDNGVTDPDDPGSGSCSLIPSETAGPFPGDGSNGPNVLNQTGVVRQDIRSSFGGLSGTAAGIPLTVVLNLVSASGNCAAKAGAAVYLWHCDQAGLYSLYSAGVTAQNYLRGVQAADSAGRVTFTTIFPGCYDGRWPHMHFEVFDNLAASTNLNNRIRTSQLALPESTCRTVYATTGYAQSLTNLGRITLASDNVFGEDRGASQLAGMTGDTRGYTATLTVAV
jgi:protocatechuate 3,4-dioxygenase beta subunit